jgi:hypothetical protein
MDMLLDEGSSRKERSDGRWTGERDRSVDCGFRGDSESKKGGTGLAAKPGGRKHTSGMR